jgi:hypothetical protein
VSIKVWDGSAFVDAPPKIWDGSAFVDPVSAFVWDGTEFVLVWSGTHEPELTAKVTAGAYSYTIPPWCKEGDLLDVVIIGGGGAGQGGSPFSDAMGGFASKWVTATLVIGTDVPVGATITGVVGAGAVGIGVGTPAAGGNTTAVIPVKGTLTSNGGAGGTNLGVLTGGSPGDVTVKGQLYQGGIGGQTSGADGTAPGSGGAGIAGGSVGNGGSGGTGRAYFRARQLGEYYPAVYRTGGPGVDGGKGLSAFTFPAVKGDTVLAFIYGLATTVSSMQYTPAGGSAQNMTLVSSQPFNNSGSIGVLYCYKFVDNVGGNATITPTLAAGNQGECQVVAYQAAGSVSAGPTAFGPSGSQKITQAATIASPGDTVVNCMAADTATAVPWTAAMSSGGTVRKFGPSVNVSTVLRIADTLTDTTFGIDDGSGKSVGNWASLNIVVGGTQ